MLIMHSELWPVGATSNRHVYPATALSISGFQTVALQRCVPALYFVTGMHCCHDAAVSVMHCAGASPEPFVDAAPRLIRTQSPEVGQKGKGSQLREGAKLREGVKLRDSANGTATTNGAVRSRTPKSHQVRLSCDETSPARSLSRGSSTGSRARSLDYSKNSGTGTARPGTARRPVVRTCCLYRTVLVFHAALVRTIEMCSVSLAVHS